MPELTDVEREVLAHSEWLTRVRRALLIIADTHPEGDEIRKLLQPASHTDRWFPPLTPANRQVIREVLNDCEEYFDQRSDAEYFTDSPNPVPNEEMTMLARVQEALRQFPEEPA